MTLCYGILFLMWCEQAPPPPVITVCPPIKRWEQNYQSRLADEIERLPKGSAVGEALRDHIRLREQIRACQKR